ncbi:unnamed protein product [Taenia asiatica]|uniref:Uncharacterized protein n=1 Tax=Taenia asiatica TaxID=60517 RepID=A0A0R3VZM8_TAEAS|nr:unnamed protein product [Taenia asiatica]
MRQWIQQFDAGMVVTEEISQLAPSTSRTNEPTVVDFDPFSTLHTVEVLLRAILHPPDPFTNDILKNWLLLSMVDGVNFIQDIFQSPISFKRLSHEHQNLCIGWFAFFCEHMPRIMEEHQFATKMVFLPGERHEFFIDFCEKLQQCLPRILAMGLYNKRVYRTWRDFYRSL